MNPTTEAPKNILIVTKGDLKAIESLPIELRALFDPKADRELAERIEQERAAAKNAATDEEPPF
jgi:hypothetical protein